MMDAALCLLGYAGSDASDTMKKAISMQTHTPLNRKLTYRHESENWHPEDSQRSIFEPVETEDECLLHWMKLSENASWIRFKEGAEQSGERRYAYESLSRPFGSEKALTGSYR
jgi:hypothetical protein